MQWILVCNSNVFDLKGALKENNVIDWPQIDNVVVGDIAYFYMSLPYDSILFKCQVERVDRHRMEESTKKYIKHPLFYDNRQTYMQLRLLETYPEALIKGKDIMEKGFHNLQMSSRVPDDFSKYVDKKKKEIGGLGKKSIKWLIGVASLLIGTIIFLVIPSKPEPTSNPEIMINQDLLKYSDMTHQLVCEITTLADYSQNLDPADYSFYQSEQEREFNFYYPPKLYNKAELSKNINGDPYGIILENISFYGSDKESAANYQLIRRETGRTRVEDTQLLYDSYEQNMIGFQKVIFHDGADERPGRMIVIGYTDSSQTVMTYLLVQITDKHIMRMEINSPTDGNRNSEDFWQKEYVVECMYRLCGFSGSSKMPQTYQEFYDAKQTAKNVSDSTIAIKSDLRKYQNMTYSQYKEMTGADVVGGRENMFGGDIPNTNLWIVFRGSYFEWDDGPWYQLQEHDLCYRLEGTLGALLDNIVGEMTIEDLKNALSQGTIEAKKEYGQGYAGGQTLSESWVVITFDSNQDGQYDAEVHVDLMEKSTIGPETLAWVVLDLRDNNTEVLGWDE